ncbi:Dopey-like protein [Elsinoe fawcettii]|nr:Dopey-like protein [Elsinoe fawcettii]
MSLEPGAAKRPISPPSGRASPNLRAGRKIEDALKSDKSTRRYATGIEKALASFDPLQQEWADCIAFLGRLLRAIQSVKETDIIPHSALVSLRLAQCLNPSLPSGVHQKALDVYACIFNLLGRSHLGRDLQVFLPGLLPLLSFASLTVRPLLYDLYDEHILKLGNLSLRPAVKSIILGLLPGIEDETSEDFERGIHILDRLRRIIAVEDAGSAIGPTPGDGYFWQCFFLSVITSENRRQGALAFLTRRLPSFGSKWAAKLSDGVTATNGSTGIELTPEADSIVRPEPGLLIRCFAAGLSDTNILVQRGFLDLLVTHLPLHSKLLQSVVQHSDLDLLVSAAVTVVLRRDMSLNRRLWSWFLGPESTATEGDAIDSGLKTPVSDSPEGTSTNQAAYFRSFGATSLQRCLLAMFTSNIRNTNDRAKPFRICSALMDRWEIGGYLVPTILIPALSAAFEFYESNTKEAAAEVLKSASLFFDGVESGLIWANMINELSAVLTLATHQRATSIRKLHFLNFVVQKFNIREEDMLVVHIPQTVLVALHGLSTLSKATTSEDEGLLEPLISFILTLVAAIPAHAFSQEAAIGTQLTICDEQCQQAVDNIKRTSADIDHMAPTPLSASLPPKTSALLLFSSATVFTGFIAQDQLNRFASQAADLFIGLSGKTNTLNGVDIPTLCGSMSRCLDKINSALESGRYGFLLAVSIINVWMIIDEQSKSMGQDLQVDRGLEQSAAELFWRSLSPTVPKHHVEAVRLLWRLGHLSGSSDNFDIESFVTERMLSPDSKLCEYERFTILWEHSVQNQPMRTERKASTLTRRTSNYTHQMEVSSLDAEQLLQKPLMVLLDSLEVIGSDFAAFSIAWLRSLPSMDRIFSGLLGQLEAQFANFKSLTKAHNTVLRQHRAQHEGVAALQRTTVKITNILQRGSESTWKVLGEIRSQEEDEKQSALSGTEFLAQFCIEVIRTVDSRSFETIHRQLLRLLDLLLESDSAAVLQHLVVEDTLISVIRDLIKFGKANLQIEYLSTITKALGVREAHQDDKQTDTRSVEPPHRASDATKLSVESSRAPPAGLFESVREAISSSSSHQVLEHWMSFLTGVLPIYSQVMFSAMIPLVECFCTQINVVFRNLRVISTSSVPPTDQIPISSLPWLLHGLELVLASAHSGLETAGPEISTARPSPSTQTLFGNSIMSPIGNPNKTARSNSRLTVILCVHDAVEICFNMWAWASYHTEGDEADPTSAATTTFNALKLRNRTKKILEHLFAAEGLECTEKMATLYGKARDGYRTDYDANNVFSLLNVLGAARPRNTVPLVLNALYSRTNMDALDFSRRSTLTCDLSAMEVVDFLLQYISTIEDDALDEVWSDCITFLRDVLSNPLPHRQILPALLEFIALLAEKIDNTNFGELQQMHRALADLFSRLLTAMFTARPSGGSYDSASRPGKSKARTGDLITSLNVVAPKLQTILEAPDRVLQAVNNMTTYAVGPFFHAKAFPENIKAEVLQLVILVSTQAPEAKLWKREVNDAFSDSRIFATPAVLMTESWFPLLRKWSLTEKTLVTDILARIVAPSTAALMFGVGANSARLAADRTAEQNLRRTALLLLANDRDVLVPSIPTIDAKVGELCTASPSSSPSCATRAEVFMLWRALFLSTSEIHVAGLWPTINATLQAAILSALPDGAEQDTYNNLSLLQACKLLDLLATIQPDDFQLHEWLFITNTIDAVYAGTYASTAIVDEVAEALAVSANDSPDKIQYDTNLLNNEPGQSGTKRPMLAGLKLDAADAKAMAREDFIRQALMPFFSGISMSAYEKTYGMGNIDLDACRKDLVEDLMNEDTVV